jgi:hypothetical protein
MVNGGYTDGHAVTGPAIDTVVLVPAAAWLFGSADASGLE